MKWIAEWIGIMNELHHELNWIWLLKYYEGLLLRTGHAMIQTASSWFVLIPTEEAASGRGVPTSPVVLCGGPSLHLHLTVMEVSWRSVQGKEVGAATPCPVGGRWGGKLAISYQGAEARQVGGGGGLDA